ncbi:MAG: SPOR domain-containing protein [Deltaproteobacteria bacterium]|nr:SPOR domain-containing protein [Deltaproteobacteria bacterium]
MANKGLFGLALGAGLVVFLAVLLVYYPRGPKVEPPQPEAAKEMPYRTAPEFSAKPPSAELPSAPVQEPSPPSPSAKVEPQPAVPPASTAAEPPAPQAHTELQPEEGYGLLVGRYRTHKEALKVMENLQKEGKPVFLRHDGRQRLPYAVWAGPFPSQEETRVAATAIKKKFKVSLKQEKLQLPVPK